MRCHPTFDGDDEPGLFPRQIMVSKHGLRSSRGHSRISDSAIRPPVSAFASRAPCTLVRRALTSRAITFPRSRPLAFLIALIFSRVDDNGLNARTSATNRITRPEECDHICASRHALRNYSHYLPKMSGIYYEGKHGGQQV